MRKLQKLKSVNNSDNVHIHITCLVYRYSRLNIYVHIVFFLQINLNKCPALKMYNTELFYRFRLSM